MPARIALYGSDIHCACEGAEVYIRLTPEQMARMKRWADDYHKALEKERLDEFPRIGQEIFQWLDREGWATAFMEGVGARELEIAAGDPRSPEESALLNMPWELLAGKGDYLALDPNRPYVVYRSLKRSKEAQAAEARHGDLGLLFMAAAPRGQHELDFEGEEAAILEATHTLPLWLWVEESGSAEFLGRRLALEGGADVVHLSCHGNIEPKTRSPILLLETPEGYPDRCEAGKLAESLGEEKPLLLFLSACRTAESAESTSDKTLVESLAQQMLQSGVPNVLGWDGSVRDRDATAFAREFYEQLAKHQRIPYAAAQARRELLRTHLADKDKGRHWHLARVYIGPQGGGPCSKASKALRETRKEGGYKEFLDKKGQRVPVASAREFVGRRRAAQTILGAFREGKHSGVLLYGMGNLGKSSLAARVANRMAKHSPVVIVDRYDARSIWTELVKALPPGERASWKQDHEASIQQNGAALGDALEDMLGKVFHQHPILLVIDDLEQVLDKPKPEEKITPVKDAPGERDVWRQALGAVLGAFEAKRGNASKLLITSRYDFELPDGRGGDKTKDLKRIPLTPMEGRERIKQWRAAARVARQEAEKDKDERVALVERILGVAGGNPGLQQILCKPVLNGEMETALRAVEAVEGFKATGQVPKDENAAQEFFRRVSFETYREALNRPQRVQLKAGTLFMEGLAVPKKAMERVGKAYGVGDPAGAIERLMGLGLMDGWAEGEEIGWVSVNPLARGLEGVLAEDERKALAKMALEPVVKAWRNEKGKFPPDERGEQAARLALLGGAEAEVLDEAAVAGGWFLYKMMHDAREALQIMGEALSQLETMGARPSAPLLRVAALCSERLGEVGLRVRWLKQGMELYQEDPVERAMFAVEHAEATLAQEGPDKAEAVLREAAEVFEKAGDVHRRAVTLGKVADILQARGQLDEALRIRQQEELPVYEKLGDVRSRAVTWGKVADILHARGQLDEALRIRQQEQLPVFEKLGDVRERAITWGQVADILHARGQLDEALRIRQQEQLPVYEKLGDVRERAVTWGKVADILHARGQLDEALRIRQQEQLPVYEKLGDVRERAVALGKVADILHARGQLDEALRIRQQEELPVFEKLGDVRERAVALGKVADILQARGQLDDALHIRWQEQLPVYEKLRDVRARAVTWGKVADILQARGQFDEALRILQEEVQPAFEKLGAVRERAVTWGKVAGIYEARGRLDDALRIYLEECLPVALQLQDIDSLAYIRLRCAHIRLERGGLDQGEAQMIHDELAESFTLCKQTGRPEGIAPAGALLAQVLAGAGHTEPALKVLDTSIAACELLQWTEAAAQLRLLQVQIRAQIP